MRSPNRAILYSKSVEVILSIYKVTNTKLLKTVLADKTQTYFTLLQVV